MLIIHTAPLFQFLEYHMIPQEMYISVQRHRLQYRYPTITGDFIRMRTSRDDAGRHATVLNEYAEIQGDATRATNGVIYVISETLHCPCLDGEVSFTKRSVLTKYAPYFSKMATISTS